VSAPDPAGTSRAPLLVVIDPVARLTDGESVRIARDVLCAGAPGVKVCLPENPEETERALARRGSRRPVVVGDDRALLRAVQLLYRERELGEAALSVVPVGTDAGVALTRGLGVPPDAVSAARTALEGVSRRLDLLIDDSGGVVLGGLHIPENPDAGARADRLASAWPPGCAPLSRTRRSLTRSMRVVRGARGEAALPAQRLRVEADGELLSDLDELVTEVSVVPDDGMRGLAQVTVLPEAASRSGPVRARARAVTVSGPDFRYRADALVGGPVRMRTWTALARAWTLTLPE